MGASAQTFPKDLFPRKKNTNVPPSFWDMQIWEQGNTSKGTSGITPQNLWNIEVSNIGGQPKSRGLHLVKPCHSTFVRGIWNNTPIFKKYWKIPPKIIFFNPLPICLANFKKPLFSLYIACINFFVYIFYTPLDFYLVYWHDTRHSFFSRTMQNNYS